VYKRIMITVSEGQKKKLADIAQKYSLELLLLFGSQVTGKTHQESDFDIGYLASSRLDLDEQGRLINDLLAIVKPKDERLINLVPIRNANALLLYAMTKNAQVLYEGQPMTFARLRAYAFKKYIETKPLYELKFERLGKIIKSYDI